MRLLVVLLFIVLSLGALLLPWILEKPSQGIETPDTAHLPAIPDVPVRRNLPDFMSMLDVTEKKEEFFRFLLPLVEAENLRILHDRALLTALHQRFINGQLSDGDKRQLEEWLDYYRLENDLVIGESLFGLLKRRIDIIPEMMVLVQAANESGWGTSRFSRQGLNLFGQWCYSEGCGLVPTSRTEGSRHEVAKFSSVNASIKSYMRNINTHGAYLDLRLLREQKRMNNADIKAKDLIVGLSSYSERGEDYIDELRAMIRINRPIVERISEELSIPEVPQ